MVTDGSSFDDPPRAYVSHGVAQERARVLNAPGGEALLWTVVKLAVRR